MSFTTKEKEIITYGKANGKSQQEVQDAIIRLRTGTPTTPAPTEKPQESLAQDTFSDFKQIGSDILKSSEKRAENIQGIRSKMEAGTKGAVPAILEGAGQLAGAGSDAIGAVVKGAFKMILPPRAEKAAKEVVQTLGADVIKQPKVQELIHWYNELPDNDKDALDAVGGVLSLATDFAGVGAVKKGATVLKEGAEQGLETAGKVAKQTIQKGLKSTEGALEIAGTVAKDIIPSADRLVNETVSKALYLSPGDIKNISKATGNEVGTFIAKYNLIGKNTEETTKMINDFFKTNYAQVRSEIAKVPTLYHAGSIPRYTDALKSIQKVVNDVPGMEKVSAEVDVLLNNVKNNKSSISLTDVQRVKELMDEQFSLYKVTGDVKESVAKEGLANMRKDLKKFIEKQVKEKTGADISDLNNKVMTSRSIMDAIETRAPKGIVKSNLQIGDLGAFGFGSWFGGPLGGVAAVIAKKMAQSPAIMLRFARFVDKLSDARKLKLIDAIKAGEVPKEIEEIINP